MTHVERSWRKLCGAIAGEARKRGAKDPFIFACESGLVVLNGPPFAPDGTSRQDAILFTLPWPSSTEISCDAGGW